jgi:hypothetical protein
MAQQTFSGVPGTFSAGEILTASDQEKLRDFLLYMIKDGDETDTGEVSPVIMDLGNDRVGINIAAPNNTLDVIGDLFVGDTSRTYAGHAQYGGLCFPRGEVFFSNTNAQNQIALASNATMGSDSGWDAINTGVSALFACDNGNIIAYNAVSVSAGATPAFQTRLKILTPTGSTAPYFEIPAAGDHVFVLGASGWDGAGDAAIVRLGSSAANEVFGCGYVYGTGMVLSVYKAGGGGSFGSNSFDAVTLTDGGSAGNMSIAGALSKGSGTFDIPHPVKGGDWRLRHSFIEGPQADLIYRGTVTLSGGSGTIDLDTASHMTDGTWEALCRDPWAMVASSGNAVEWSLSGKTLTVTSDTADAVCSWMVMAERQDDHMKDVSTIADPDGHLIVEYEKEAIDPNFKYPGHDEEAEGAA